MRRMTSITKYSGVAFLTMLASTAAMASRLSNRYGGGDLAGKLSSGIDSLSTSATTISASLFVVGLIVVGVQFIVNPSDAKRRLGWNCVGIIIATAAPSIVQYFTGIFQ